MLPYDNCPHCFRPLGGGTVCSACGYDHSTAKQYTGVLPPFTVLNGRYLLGRVLGKGGFGITYVAQDLHTHNRICAIKEFMPAEYSSRRNGTFSVYPFADDKARFVFEHGRMKFKEEARTLMRLRNNPVVVDILDFFSENNTAYLVMEYIDGETLRAMAKRQGGKLDVEYAKTVFVTVASALMEIHRMNILHRDLSPENIMVTKDGRIKMIDFGAARNFVRGQNKGMSILLKVGFTPPEQYDSKGTQGPWSDIYALCATFYNVVSGKPLQDAMYRYRGAPQLSLYALGCPVTRKTSDVIERGMELDYRKRYKDFKALLDDIDMGPGPGAAPGHTESIPEVLPKPQPKPQPPKEARPYVAAIIGGKLYNKMYLSSDYLKIGRSKLSCQIVVTDSSISRVQCYLYMEGNKIYLTDTSSNGTFFADGTRLTLNKNTPVAPGTKFYLATKNHMFIVDNKPE